MKRPTEQRHRRQLRMRKYLGLALGWAWLALAPRVGAQAPPAPQTRQVLFICTGNYYRSRFTEALFNQKARQAHLGWRAASRGLALVASQHGLSPIAQRELLQRGVPRDLWQGDPKALTLKDLDRSDCVVLMEEAEHRPLLEKRFPGLDGHKLRYWHIGDTGKLKPATACQLMSKAVDELIKSLEP